MADVMHEKAAKANEPTSQQVEAIYDEKYNDEKTVGADYSGAVKKTDPEEIKLVRKLDYRIMPILWAMYFMNYVNLSVSCKKLKAKMLIVFSWIAMPLPMPG